MECLTERLNPIPSFKVYTDAVRARYYQNARVRYYQNARATTARLAAETRSEYSTVRHAALLRLVRRLGYETARDVWRQERAARGGAPEDYRFRLDCQTAAGVILAGAQ